MTVISLYTRLHAAPGGAIAVLEGSLDVASHIAFVGYQLNGANPRCLHDSSSSCAPSEEIAHPDPRPNRVSRCEVQLRYRLDLAAQLRLGVELRLVPLHVEQVLNNQLDLAASEPVAAVEVEHGIPLGRKAVGLVRWPVADVPVPQGPFPPARMPCGQASGRRDRRRQRYVVSPRRLVPQPAPGQVDIGVGPQPRPHLHAHLQVNSDF